MATELGENEKHRLLARQLEDLNEELQKAESVERDLKDELQIARDEKAEAEKTAEQARKDLANSLSSKGGVASGEMLLRGQVNKLIEENNDLKKKKEESEKQLKGYQGLEEQVNDLSKTVSTLKQELREEREKKAAVAIGAIARPSEPDAPDSPEAKDTKKSAFEEEKKPERRGTMGAKQGHREEAKAPIPPPVIGGVAAVGAGGVSNAEAEELKKQVRDLEEALVRVKEKNNHMLKETEDAEGTIRRLQKERDKAVKELEEHRNKAGEEEGEQLLLLRGNVADLEGKLEAAEEREKKAREESKAL